MLTPTEPGTDGAASLSLSPSLSLFLSDTRAPVHVHQYSLTCMRSLSCYITHIQTGRQIRFACVYTHTDTHTHTLSLSCAFVFCQN